MWPILVGFLAVVFRRPIVALLKRLTRITHKDFHIEFGQAVQCERCGLGQLRQGLDQTTPDFAGMVACATIYHDLGKKNHAFQRLLQQC